MTFVNMVNFKKKWQNRRIKAKFQSKNQFISMELPQSATKSNHTELSQSSAFVSDEWICAVDQLQIHLTAPAFDGTKSKMEEASYWHHPILRNSALQSINFSSKDMRRGLQFSLWGRSRSCRYSISPWITVLTVTVRVVSTTFQAPPISWGHALE